MPFLTGLILLDAPASALNNQGADTTSQNENAVAVKAIRSRAGVFPYVSAQAFRYWLRTTVAAQAGWRPSPIFREAKVAYTDANPIEYWDDDLFGYMRAQSKRTGAVERRGADASRVGVETETVADITRISPFRVSTFVAIAPAAPTQDFGTMSRHEGDPVPHEHQFYRTVLKGLVSLNLHVAGTFSYQNRTGFRNLDTVRVDLSKASSLEELSAEQSYRLPREERQRRISGLLGGLAELSGGAKQAIHYTDVTPAVVMMLVTRGGNNPLQYVIGADSSGLPSVNADAVEETFKAWGNLAMSPLYVGWTQGFHDGQRTRLQAALERVAASDATRGGLALPHGYTIGHPRDILHQIVEDLKASDNSAWLD